MENIYLETQGIKGGNTKSQNVGFILIGLRDGKGRITIDDFEGCGKDYKQRESQLIEITENGNILFSGTKEQLFDILKNK